MIAQRTVPEIWCAMNRQIDRQKDRWMEKVTNRGECLTFKKKHDFYEINLKQKINQTKELRKTF